MLGKPTSQTTKLLWYKAEEVFGTYFVHATGGAQAKLLSKNLDQIAKKLDLYYLIFKVGDSMNPKQRSNAYYGKISLNNTPIKTAGKALEVLAIQPYFSTKFMRPKGSIETYVAWFKYENYLEATKLLETIKEKFPKFDFEKQEDIEEAAALIKKFGELAELLDGIEGAEADVTTLYKKDLEQKD